jgi:predicted NAD-dependent protein-ADP-ribosyltransferase YbiA (DUF1768 family)
VKGSFSQFPRDFQAQVRRYKCVFNYLRTAYTLPDFFITRNLILLKGSLRSAEVGQSPVSKEDGQWEHGRVEAIIRASLVTFAQAVSVSLEYQS